MRKLCLTTLAMSFCFSASLYSDSVNPLATTDQQALDALSVEINQNNPYTVLKVTANMKYRLIHGLFLTEPEEALLQHTVNELAFSSIQKAVNCDFYHPKVYWVNSAAKNWLGLEVPGGRYCYDNPDAIDRIIPISSDSSYLIHGERAAIGPTDVNFFLVDNITSQGVIQMLRGDDLVINEDGSYTITVDSQPANGRVNHLQCTKETVQLLIRNNLGDWLHETPDAIRVERLEDGSEHLPIATKKIESKVKGIFKEAIFNYIALMFGVQTMLQPANELSEPSQSIILSRVENQASSFGHFQIEKGEALVAHVNLSGAKYFAIVAANDWTTTIDPGSLQCSLNNKQAIPNRDGTFTFVISPYDPFVYNWLSSAGQNTGTLQALWQNLPEGARPSIELKIVPLSQLKAYLPYETKYANHAERAQQLQNRLQGYLRRFQNCCVMRPNGQAQCL